MPALDKQQIYNFCIHQLLQKKLNNAPNTDILKALIFIFDEFIITDR